MTRRTNILQVIQGTPERKSGFIGRTCLGVWISILALIFVGAGEMQAQTFKNGGVFRNTGTANYKEVQNYNGTAGTILNSGTINITKTGSGSLLNDDFGSLKGTVLNYIGGIGAGTIVCNSNTGDYSNGGGITRNDSLNNYVGTIKIQGSLTSTGTFDTDTGKVEYLGTGAQTIFNGVVNSTYGILAASTSGVKSLSGATIVNNSVQISGTASVDVAGKTLTLNGSNPFPSGGTLTANTASSSVIYNTSGAQTVHTATYYNLTIQNGGTKTASGSLTVNNNLTNTATFDLASNNLITGASASITNTSATIQTSGNVTFGATHTIAGTFIYQTTSAQTIGTANYSALTLQNSGQKNFPTGTVGVSGVYSVSGGSRSYGAGTFVYNGTSAQSVAGEGYNNLMIATTTGNATASAAVTLSGNLVINSGSTLDMAGFNTSSFPGGSNNNAGTIRWSGDNAYVPGAGTTEFYSVSAGAIASGTNYGNLLFSGTGMKTFTTNPITATGTMTVNSGALVTVNNGITLQINGDVTLNNPITNLGTINVGN